MRVHTDYPIGKMLEKLGIKEVQSGACTGTRWLDTGGKTVSSYSPADGQPISSIKLANRDDYEAVMKTAEKAFLHWRQIPAPRRGELVRQMGDALREHKEELGALVSYEMGKIHQEGMGEVQEMIDIADFALGQSRMLYGMTTKSERPNHTLSEQYHPLGIVAVITAFNFPVAVWAWNTMLALIAGDVVVWKPSSKTYLCAQAVHRIMAGVLKKNNIPEGVINLVEGSSADIGDTILEDQRIPLVSATGSTPLGQHVARIVGGRLGKTLLELGGNNAIIVAPGADLNNALNATLFGAVGTTGQRCTSTRRMIIHESIYETFKEKLVNAYNQLPDKIGHPLCPNTLVGPMIDKKGVEDFLNAQKQLVKQGGKILTGGQVIKDDKNTGTYVMPAVAEAQNHYPIVQEETFAPLLYLMKYSTIEEAIQMQNDVPQGLSSSIFSNDVRETTLFTSATGSDCGIANVNIGTSGAEIGGAFGGEKETGGGRESGSDAWKIYMRRQTNTVNYGREMPLAQGIKFNLD